MGSSRRLAEKMLQLMAIVLLVSGSKSNAEALSKEYYAATCPLAELIARNVVAEALRKDPTLAAPLLRMHFHDCFVEGCDGSVLIDSTKGNKAEKDAPPNQSLRGFEVVDQVKSALEQHCPGVVSCADIVAMAARDAVLWAGGPAYEIPMGRLDGRRSRSEDTVSLPLPTLNSSSLIKMFAQRGFTVQDMVALSGAHTLGVARCASFRNRLSNFDSVNKVDPTLNQNFAKILTKVCASGDSSVVPLDPTRTFFDNAYFRALTVGGGLLTSDQTLFTSPETKALVNVYAADKAKFFDDFSQAMLKMGLLNVKVGAAGEVRRNCRIVSYA